MNKGVLPESDDEKNRQDGPPRFASFSTADGEWPSKVAGSIEALVGTVQTRVVRPVLLVGRALVFGILVIFLALVMIILIGAGTVRLMDSYFFEHRVWLSYLVTGGFFSLVGIVLWFLRTKSKEL